MQKARHCPRTTACNLETTAVTFKQLLATFKQLFATCKQLLLTEFTLISFLNSSLLSHVLPRDSSHNICLIIQHVFKTVFNF